MMTSCENEDFTYSHIIRFAHQKVSFLISELVSISEYYGVAESIKFPSDLSFLEYSPFLPVAGINEEKLKEIVSRSVLIKHLYRVYAVAPTLSLLQEKLKSLPEKTWEAFQKSSFKFTVDGYRRKFSQEEQRNLIESFSFLPFEGPIIMKSPDVTFAILQYTDEKGTLPSVWHFGILIGESNRGIIDKYNLKKRSYIGITSMDAELALVMCQLAKIKPDSFIYDPFVGTGSTFFTSAYYEAYCFGSDIDGRQMRGKGDGKSIWSNADQYNCRDRMLDALVFDLSRHPWRGKELFDAIVTDPPYGVRAGAKRITSSSTCLTSTDVFNPKYPQTEAYATEQVIIDLVEFAAKYLVLGGRLVYWQPNIAEETDEELHIPVHQNMKLITSCEQAFNGWSRWLVVMEKSSRHADNEKGKYNQKNAYRHFRNDFFNIKR